MIPAGVFFGGQAQAAHQRGIRFGRSLDQRLVELEDAEYEMAQHILREVLRFYWPAGIGKLMRAYFPEEYRSICRPYHGAFYRGVLKGMAEPAEAHTSEVSP